MTEETSPPADVSPNPAPAAEPDEAAPSAEFEKALADFERSAPKAARPAPELAVGKNVQAKVVSIGDEHVLFDVGGRSEAVAETKNFRDAEGKVSLAVGDVADLFVTEAGDSVVLAPSLKAEPKAALGQVREAQASGLPLSGKVTGLNAGGLLVDIAGVRGFCPFSQIEVGFCPDPSVYVGKTLEFLVTEVKDGRGGAVLSRKQLLRRAEQEGAERMLATLKPGDDLDGTVARLEPFGAFVNLGGVDGLVHVSEISHDRIGHPRQALKEGERVRVRVTKVETGKDGRPRISLSIKAVQPDPWQGIAARYAVGARVKGKVARLADFGAFVALEPAVDGLVHVSEIAPQRIAHPKEALAVGQEVEAVVLAVDPEKKRISLSIRATDPNAGPRSRHPEVGVVLEGKVAGIQNYGVFVDLPEYGPRVAGLVPREETGLGRAAKLEESFTVGQAVEVEVIGFKENKIRLKLKTPLGPGESKDAPVSEPRSRAPRKGAPQPPSRPEGPAEETTMAIALRQAMERAKAKAEGKR